VLPRVLDEKNVKQQIGVVTHIVPVGKAAMPQKFSEEGLRELRIFPAAILQQLQTIFTDVSVFDELLDVAGDEKCQNLTVIKLDRSLPSTVKQQLLSFR
jgi:hypothetical protein